MDAFWSREPSTVAENHIRGERDFLEGSKEFGLVGVTRDFVQSELGYFQGMALATLDLLASLRQRKYTNHLQWDTMRKLSSAYGNFYEATGWSPLGVVLGNGEKKTVCA